LNTYRIKGALHRHQILLLVDCILIVLDKIIVVDVTLVLEKIIVVRVTLLKVAFP
jgi:hypothetical protein